MNALVAIAKSAPALAMIRSLGRKGIEVSGASDVEKRFPSVFQILLEENTLENKFR